jgi:hypothetical protein
MKIIQTGIMKKFSGFLILVFLITITGCYSDEFSDRLFSWGSEINIYIVKEGQVGRTSTDIDLKKLELERTPWISQHEIYFYDWSGHIFYLKETKEKAKYAGRYFLVKENDDPLFLGYFFPPYMSSMSPYPAIIATDSYFFPGDVVAIGGFGGYNNAAMDGNTDFKKALIRAGLFRGGINVELTGLKKKNTTTVEYSFRVTNIDHDCIYILDPDKMGIARFHYYTNGVSFTKGTTYYFPDNLNNTPSDKILTDWYYRLMPGRSITRTVELGGFKTLPSGTVSCTFSFPGSSLKSGEWKMKDGWIWLGDYYIRKEISF